MFKISKRQTDPVPRSQEKTYTDKVVSYADGWSTIEVDTPGDVVDLSDSIHKYLRNPVLNPAGSLMLQGRDQEGNRVRAFFISGELGVMEQTSPSGEVTAEAMFLDFDDMDLSDAVTIGQPYELPGGGRFEEVTGIAADHKSGLQSDQGVAGKSPFREADELVRKKFPGIESGDLTPAY